MARRVKTENEPGADALAQLEEFRRTQLGRLLATDPPTGKRVRDLPVEARERRIRSALVARARRAGPDDWSRQFVTDDDLKGADR